MARTLVTLCLLLSALAGLFFLLGPGGGRPSPSISHGEVPVDQPAPPPEEPLNSPSRAQPSEPPRATPERSAQDEPPAPGGPAPLAPTAAVPEAMLEELRSLLQRELPERFGDLTAEELVSLQALDLHGAEISDADLRLIGSLTQLEHLGLRGTEVTDEGMVALGQLNSLSQLDLRGTEIEGTGLYQIPLQKLTSLHLTDTNFGSDEMYRLPRMPELQTLKLNFLEIDDEALQVLGHYPNLRHVELDQTGISGQGLEYLMAENPQLTRIELRGTNIDEATLARMRLAYPNCVFVHESPNLPAALRGG